MTVRRRKVVSCGNEEVEEQLHAMTARRPDIREVSQGGMSTACGDMGSSGVSVACHRQRRDGNARPVSLLNLH